MSASSLWAWRKNGRGHEYQTGVGIRTEPFAITNPQWQQQLKAVCDTVQTELGVVEPIEFELYLSRWSEKPCRFSATLLVTLKTATRGRLGSLYDGNQF